MLDVQELPLFELEELQLPELELQLPPPELEFVELQLPEFKSCGRSHSRMLFPWLLCKGQLEEFEEGVPELLELQELSDGQPVEQFGAEGHCCVPQGVDGVQLIEPSEFCTHVVSQGVTGVQLIEPSGFCTHVVSQGVTGVQLIEPSDGKTGAAAAAV